ncbi:MAG: flavodoxin family protein [Candidatus Brocadiaceae bacterium]|jgi:multimeric flavodoxin WrbA
MYVLGVNGSGRADGNTAVLVAAVLEGAEAAGASTGLLQLAQMQFQGCDGCQRCKESHRCAVRDDMDRFYELAAEADVLVPGSPIYLDHVTGQMKSFIDRLYCYLGPKLENHYPNPAARAVPCITYGAGGDETYDGVLEWMSGRLSGYFGIPTIGTFALPGAGFRPVVGEEHPIIRHARAFGESLLERGRG